MNSVKTNAPHNFSTGLSIDYYDKYIENIRSEDDIFILNINILYQKINGAEDPYERALDFANYILENGENLLPAIIDHYVVKFKALSPAIRDYVIKNTRATNNYFRDDNGSDKLAILGNVTEYRNRSSSNPDDNKQDPETNISENIQNKISPNIFKETLFLSSLVENITKLSVPEKGVFNSITNSTHNNFKTITPSLDLYAGAKEAKTDIETDTYNDFEDCYRVKRLFKFKHNPYNVEMRQDFTSDFIVDENPDITTSKIIYTQSGNVLAKPKIDDFYTVMPLSREEMNKPGKTNTIEYPPIIGSLGSKTNKLNDNFKDSNIKSYDASKHRKD